MTVCVRVQMADVVREGVMSAVPECAECLVHVYSSDSTGQQTHARRHHGDIEVFFACVCASMLVCV